MKKTKFNWEDVLKEGAKFTRGGQKGFGDVPGFLYGLLKSSGAVPESISPYTRTAFLFTDQAANLQRSKGSDLKTNDFSFDNVIGTPIPKPDTLYYGKIKWGVVYSSGSVGSFNASVGLGRPNNTTGYKFPFFNRAFGLDPSDRGSSFGLYTPTVAAGVMMALPDFSNSEGLFSHIVMDTLTAVGATLRFSVDYYFEGWKIDLKNA